jgi:serine/alanine racemase
MIDVTDIDNVKIGDIVTLIGSDGNETITAEEVASQAGTITNEIFSRLGRRLDII